MQHGKIWLWLLTPLLACGAASENPSTPAPPLPPILGIELQPAQLTLKDRRDERRVLVLGKTGGTNFIDLNGSAGPAVIRQTVCTEIGRPYILTFDVNANWSFSRWGQLYLSARNVLDTQAIVSRRPYGARPNAPRTVILGFKLNM